MVRRVILLVVCLFVASSPGRAEAAPCWPPPVVGVVTDPFRPPPCPYCAGNRGLEYRVGANTLVSAVASGTVTWSGRVVGTRYVVVRHANGWRTTYGKLTSSPLSVGDVVVRGSPIGRASVSFYFGLRLGDDYADPAPFLGRSVGRPRLVPVDGTRPRRAPAPRLICGAR